MQRGISPLIRKSPSLSSVLYTQLESSPQLESLFFPDQKDFILIRKLYPQPESRIVGNIMPNQQYMGGKPKTYLEAREGRNSHRFQAFQGIPFPSVFPGRALSTASEQSARFPGNRWVAAAERLPSLVYKRVPQPRMRGNRMGIERWWRRRGGPGDSRGAAIHRGLSGRFQGLPMDSRRRLAATRVYRR